MSIRATAARFLGVSCLAILLLGGVVTDAQTEGLPAGRGREILEASCTACHGLEEVIKLRGKLARDEWRALVKTMTEYGAEVDAKDVEVLVDYLDRELGKRD